MDIDEEVVDTSADEIAEEPVAENSVIESLRDLRESIGEEKTIDMALPGYKGMLIARYRRIEYREMERIARNVEKMQQRMNPNANLFGQCDLLGVALEGIYLRKDQEKPDELIPLAEAYGNGAQRSGWDLAAMVVSPDGRAIPDTVRGQIRAVINDDLAVGAHQADLASWLNGEREDEEEDFG